MYCGGSTGFDLVHNSLDFAYLCPDKDVADVNTAKSAEWTKKT